MLLRLIRLDIPWCELRIDCVSVESVSTDVKWLVGWDKHLRISMSRLIGGGTWCDSLLQKTNKLIFSKLQNENAVVNF